MWDFNIIISLIALAIFIHEVVLKDWFVKYYQTWKQLENYKFKMFLKPFGFCPQCITGQFVFWGLLLFGKTENYNALEHLGITALSILIIKTIFSFNKNKNE